MKSSIIMISCGSLPIFWNYCKLSCMAAACPQVRCGEFRAHDNWSAAWPQVQCGGIGSTWKIGETQVANRSFQVYSMWLNFGKHRTKHMNQVDDDCLEWMVKTFSEADPWWKAAADALTRRGKMKWQHSAKRNVHVHDLLSELKSCTRKKDLQKGKWVHTNAVETGIDSNMYVAATLINMYAKCGSMEDARTVFDKIQEPDVVSWTAVILGYAENGQGHVALDLFSRMKDECRSAPNSVTYVAALKACTSLAADGDETGKKVCLAHGREIHSEVGYHMNHFVQNMLIDMYAKCGNMEQARTVFDSIREPDVVSWNALILGYVDNGQGLVALDWFSRMKDDCRCVPDPMTYVAALKACGSIGAFAVGRRLHSEIQDFDAHLVTCLVDFYAKCGNMEEAREVFELHPRARDVSTWTALLAGYGRFVDTASVFSLFEAMEDQGFRPNAITFVCMLTCCSHAGLVEKGWEYLQVMPTRYGITPTVMHYTCMIDLLGRANKLYEAVAVLQEMPCNPDTVTWKTLLGACRKWKNVEIGRLAFKSLVDLDLKKASAYILMAEVYGSRGMWEERERLLGTRMESGAWKLPGQAYGMDGLGMMVTSVVGEEDHADVEDTLKHF